MLSFFRLPYFDTSVPRKSGKCPLQNSTVPRKSSKFDYAFCINIWVQIRLSKIQRLKDIQMVFLSTKPLFFWSPISCHSCLFGQSIKHASRYFQRCQNIHWYKITKTLDKTRSSTLTALMQNLASDAGYPSFNSIKTLTSE